MIHCIVPSIKHSKKELKNTGEQYSNTGYGVETGQGTMYSYRVTGCDAAQFTKYKHSVQYKYAIRFDRVPVFCMSLACVFVWLVLCDDGRHRIWEDPENRDSIPIYLRVGGPHRYITRTATHDGRPCGLVGMVIFNLGLLVFSCSCAVCTLFYRC